MEVSVLDSRSLNFRVYSSNQPSLRDSQRALVHWDMRTEDGRSPPPLSWGTVRVISVTITVRYCQQSEGIHTVRKIQHHIAVLRYPKVAYL